MRYRVDSADRISELGPEWDSFASANGAEGLTPEKVVGRPLWDFVAGRETRELYRMVFRRIRERGSRVVLAFRCDAPELRRFMEVEMAPMDDGDIELEVRMVRAEERVPAVLLDPTAARTQELVVVCSWCKRVRSDERTWLEVEEAIQRLGLFCAVELPQLTHGVCPSCERAVRREIDDEPDPEPRPRPVL